MFTLDTKKFSLSLLGALMIIAGVSIKNTHEQMKSTNKTMPVVGMGLFLIGWMVIIVSLLVGGPDFSSKSFFTVLSVLLIVTAVIAMKKFDLSPDMKKIVPLLFIIGWVLLGYTVGMNHTSLVAFNKKTLIGLVGSVLVIASMTKVLPWQRLNSIVDGPGMAMFTAGWGSIILGNSLM